MKSGIFCPFIVVMLTVRLFAQSYYTTDSIFVEITVRQTENIFVDATNITGPWDGTPAHPYRTIRDGLAAATKGKTVVVQAGTYQITANLTVADSVTLFLRPKVINKFNEGTGITINGKLQAMGTVTDSVLFIPEQVGIQWDGIRFINSNTGSELRFCRIEYANGTGEGKGGAIYCSNSSPKLSHCVLQSNQANYGGALFCENGSSPEISYCTITNNTASVGGSGIFSQSATPIILQNYIINNTCNGLLGGAGIVLTQAKNLQSRLEAKQTELIRNFTKVANVRQIGLAKASLASRRELPPVGGLISLARKSEITKDEGVQTESVHRSYFGKVPIIEGNTFSQNVCATSGGALALYQDHAIVYDNTFVDNQAMQGGAIYQAQTDSVKIEWNLYETNSADLGGSIFVDGGKANNLARNLFLHNRADFGAGACLDTTEVDFSQNTLFSNQASNAGGSIYSHAGENIVKNTICWDNDSLNAEQISGTGLAVSFCNIEGGYTGAGNIAADPMFVDTTRIGFRLRFQSPCINAGDPNSPQDPDSSRADMGAYYYHRIFSKLTLSQDSLQVSLLYEDSLTRFLTLSNIGKNELHWVITDTPNWLTVRPQIGVIASSASQQLRIEIRTAALRPDQTYHSVIALYSNDENKSDSLIAVTLEVIDRFTIVQLNIGAHGYCWGDYDNDGDLDCYGFREYIIVNDGRGNWGASPHDPEKPIGSARGAAWGDYNNDGYLDLLILPSNGMWGGIILYFT